MNSLVIGCLARAQKHTGATVHAVAVLSNHMHGLFSFDSVEQMAQFMCHFKTNLSKEIGRIHDWPNALWSGRYHSIPLSDEPEVQVSRLAYILKQGAKEGLVLSPLDWPGVQSARALLEGQPLRGVWVDRTKLFAARRWSSEVSEKDVTTDEELHLEPLPCWADRSAERRQAEVANMIREIEHETVAMHKRQGTVPMGAEAIRRCRPHERPDRLEKSPRPRFHAATKKVRELLMSAYREFVIAYRQASEKLAEGDLGVRFPENCYPPGLPFVPPTSF